MLSHVLFVLSHNYYQRHHNLLPGRRGRQRVMYVGDNEMLSSTHEHAFVFDTLIFLSLQSTRGQDVQIFIVDEANFISPKCYDGLLPHAQKRGGKLIFTSSSASAPTQEKGNMSNLAVLRDTLGVLYVSLTYVCNDHLTEFVSQTKRTTCDCFMHLEPFHVDNNVADRSVADRLNEATGRGIGYLLDRGVSHSALIARGMDDKEIPLLMNSTISKMLEDVKDTHAMVKTHHLDTTLIVYVDTCAHLSPYSKNGMSVCSHYLGKDGTSTGYVVLAVDHCYHVGSSFGNMSMFQFVPDVIIKLLSKTCSLHPRHDNKTESHFTKAFIVIEHNSYDLTETVGNLHDLLIHNRPAVLHNVHVSCLYHKAMAQHMFSLQTTIIDQFSGKRETCNVKPGFILGSHKTEYFKKVLDMMRTGNVSLSQSLTSVYVEPSGKESLQSVVMEHLSNIRAQNNGTGTTYRGKGKWKQDDLAVSVIMSIYIALNKHRYIWKTIGC